MRGKGIILCIFIVILGCFFSPRTVYATEIRDKDEQAELQKEAEETIWKEFEFSEIEDLLDDYEEGYEILNDDKGPVSWYTDFGLVCDSNRFRRR